LFCFVGVFVVLSFLSRAMYKVVVVVIFPPLLF